ncbi:MAG: radical SAM protein [Vicinamibacteraceae bacterium]
MSRPINASEALALTFLGATGDAAAASALLSACVPARDGDVWVRRVIDRFWCYLGGGAPRTPDWSWLEQLDASRTLAALRARREPAPSAVIWVVTLGCNRRCPYCFYEVFGHAAGLSASPPDATFPLDDAIRMVREMSRIGASDLYLTGGEPLLRRDLPEIIAAAATHRVRTRVTTKYPVDAQLAKQLANAGLSHATFSLDDARERQSAALAGARGFLPEAQRAICALLEAGIELDVNAVLTARNVDGLDGLAELLIELGVPRLTLSPYSLPIAAKPAAHRLAAGRLDLPALVAALCQRYGGRIAIEAGSAAIAEGGETCSATAVCDVGFRDLHVLPDGSVTRCRYLPGRDEMRVGSLREQSILEIWNGRPLALLNDPREERYGSSPCVGCTEFAGCNGRGRCYYTALSRSGAFFAPDDFCRKESVH